MFIGKNLDHDELREGFEKCIPTPSSRREASRPSVWSTRSSAARGRASSRVTELLYRDEYMPAGVTAPYQIQLDSGELSGAEDATTSSAPTRETREKKIPRRRACADEGTAPRGNRPPPAAESSREHVRSSATRERERARR